LNVEILYDNAVIVAAGAHSKWARRRKIDLAELIDEPWILAGPTSWNRRVSAEMFRARGLGGPEPMVTADSIILRARLVAGGPYLAMFTTSVLRRLIADHYAITALPVDLPANAFSAGIVTLKDRTLSPVVERFLACVREVAASSAGKQSYPRFAALDEVQGVLGVKMRRTQGEKSESAVPPMTRRFLAGARNFADGPTTDLVRLLPPNGRVVRQHAHMRRATRSSLHA